MSQLKFYKRVTWGLLFLNIGMLAFFLLTKPGPPHQKPRHAFEEEIVELLNLDNEQKAEFEKMAMDHHEKMNTISHKQSELLPVYFETLVNQKRQIDTNRIKNQYQQLEWDKIQVTHAHFEQLKLLLNDNQVPHFQTFVDKIMDRLINPQKKSNPPPKDF